MFPRQHNISNCILNNSEEYLLPKQDEVDSDHLPSVVNESEYESTHITSTNTPSTPLSLCYDNVTCSPVWVQNNPCTCSTEGTTSSSSPSGSALITQSDSLRDSTSCHHEHSTAASTFLTAGSGLCSNQAPLANIAELRHIDNSPSPPKPISDSARCESSMLSRNSSAGQLPDGSQSRSSDGRPKACISLQHLFDMEAVVNSVSGYRLSTDVGIACHSARDDVANGYINPVTVFTDEVDRRSEAQSLVSYDTSPRKPGCHLQGPYPSPSATRYNINCYK